MKKRMLWLICVIVILGFALPVGAQTPAPGELRSRFADPPAGYGPVPLWWWDADELQMDRLEWQLDQLKAQGVNSTCVIYLEPNEGEPPYFSDAWWDIWCDVVEECEERDMTIWFYDQIGFGSAGWQRELAEEHPDLAGQNLDCMEKRVEGDQKVTLKVPSGADLVSASACKVKDGVLNPESTVELGDQVKDGTLTWQAPSGEWLVSMVIARGTGLLDPLDRNATDLLIDELYMEYERHCGDALGSTIPGSFQDELVVWGGRGRRSGMLPWTDNFAREFRRRKGYDLLPALPALWHDVGKRTPKVRIDYWDVVVALAEERFYEPIYDWHEERDMLVTHDQWGRRSMQRQTTRYGDYYRTQSWYQGPGYDDAGRHPVGTRNFRDAKLSSSIAHLYERPRVWCEAFHSSGWGLTPAEMTAWSNENWAFGATLYDKHGLYYSTYDGWWEWAPPSAHFRQPYWRHYHRFAHYITRLSYLLSRGVHRCDAAVLYPVTTMQAGLSAGRNFSDHAKAAENAAWTLGETMFRRALDMDYIDHGSIARAKVEGGKLLVAGEAYRALVLPAARTVRRSTVKKALEFCRAGGLVVASDGLPVNSVEAGRDDPELARMVERIFGTTAAEAREKGKVRQSFPNGGTAVFVGDELEGVTDLVTGAIQRDFVPTSNDAYVLHRKIGRLDAYFVFNIRDEAIMLDAFCRTQGTPQIWDAWDGTVAQHHRFQPVGNGVRLRLHMEPHEAKVVVFDPEENRPAVTGDELYKVHGLNNAGSVVEGTTRSGGPVTAEVQRDGKEKQLSGNAPSPAPTIALNGKWNFEVIPTMDNRWGDFRMPPTDQKIGPEARQFKYAEADEEEVAWHKKGLDDSGWATATYSFGPHFLKLGPVPAGADTKALEKNLSDAESIDTDRKVQVDGKKVSWSRYVFSKKLGIQDDPVAGRWLGMKKKVPEEFIDLGRHKPGTTFYMWTAVVAPERMKSNLLVGPAKCAAWLNGEKVLDGSSGGSARVNLRKGANPLLVKLVAGGGNLRAHAVVSSQHAPTFTPATPWIWHPEIPDGEVDCYFRRTFKLDEDVANAHLRITCDNSYKVYVNGSRVGSDAGYDTNIWSTVELYDVSELLHRGRNVISVEARNLGGAGGLIARLDAEFDGRSLRLRTGPEWRCSPEAQEGWLHADFDDSGWSRSEEVARAGAGPWSDHRLELQREEQKEGPVRLRWFEDTRRLAYDIMPESRPKALWYRFTAPPGMRSMEVVARGDLQAWVDGKKATVEEHPALYRVKPASPRQETAQVALRVEPSMRSYGGAAIPEPVKFSCGTGRAAPGKWSELGLSTYSGAVRYSREFKLNSKHLEQALILDLGQVACTAEVHVNGEHAGTCIAPPWHVDISDSVREGTNEVEIVVTNTLANHFSVGRPSRYILEGQTLSGLLGPVQIRALPRVRLDAE